jgi:pilus assembly protein CpaC
MRARIVVALVASSLWCGWPLGARAADPQVLNIDRQVSALVTLQLEAGQNRLLMLTEPIGRVSVADPNVADLKVVTPMQLLLTARSVGSTDLTLWGNKDSPLVIAVQVASNLEALRKQVKELFPDDKIVVSSSGDLVVLTGEVSDIRVPERLAQLAKLHSSKVANLVQVGGHQQVQLEVKFAEVSRSGLRQMGLNLYNKGIDGRHVAGVFSNRTQVGDFLNRNQPPHVPGTGPIGGPYGPFGGLPPDVPNQPFQGAFNIFFSAFSKFPLSGTLSLLEASGLSKTLAEPTLVTLTGQEAKFLAGGEFPIPIASTLGQTTVSWKKFGILLRFTPTVIDPSTIHLNLATEVSDIDASASITVGGTTIPGLSSRQSETTIRLGDGQSFAIAGLLSDRLRSQIDEVPFLGSLPVLGMLFRSTSYRQEETELLVVVTARLARAVAPHELPDLPTTEVDEDPNDFELFVMGWGASDGDRQDDGEGQGEGGERSKGSSGRGPSGEVGFTR